MEGGQGAGETEGLAQLGQRHVGLVGQQLADGNAVLGDNGPFAASTMMQGLDVTEFATLDRKSVV